MSDEINSLHHDSEAAPGASNEISNAPRIALFALDATPDELASLERLVTAAHTGAKVVQWPEGQSFSTSAIWFRACILLAKAPSPLELELAARPATLPLIAVGGHDPSRSRPNIWLREPSPALLSSTLRAVLSSADEMSVVAPRADDELAAHVVAPPIIAYRDAKARFESAYYSRLLRLAGGNISLAAKLAHKTRKEVYDAMKRLGLRLVEYRGRTDEA